LTIRPRLNVICGRCGKRREGLIHTCRSNSRRRATVRVRPVLGGCSRCGKTYGGAAGNPLTHVCNPRAGEFRQRKAAQRRKIRAAVTAKARAAERDRQRAKVTQARERERQRSRAQVARLKASYEKRLAAERAKTKQRHKGPARPAKPRRPAHEYQSCADKDCQRPVCAAFKEGYRDGDRDGYKRGFERGWEQGYALGWRQGYDKGFPDGIAACPRPHK
jgi:flagellar biosynthesis/type III secretory pathway protein FliH